MAHDRRLASLAALPLACGPAAAGAAIARVLGASFTRFEAAA